MALGIVSFFWGTTYLASRIGVRFMPGLFLAGLRQLIAGSILVFFYLTRGYKLPDAAVLLKISFLGVFILVIGNGVFTWSLQYISSGLASIIAALIPLWIAVFSILILKKTSFNRTILAGLTLGFLGITMIFYDNLSNEIGPAFLWGISLALISGLFWSIGTVFASRYKPDIELLFGVGIQMFVSGTVLILICLLTGQTSNLRLVPLSGWLALAYLVLIGSLLAYVAYVYAVSNLPPTRVAVYAYINPVVAISLGWIILGEQINAAIILGAGVTIYGVYLVNSGFRKTIP